MQEIFQKKIDLLHQYSSMKTENEIRAFDFLCYELANTKEAEILQKLLTIFDDNCEFPEVMYGLVHAIETYPDEIYLETVLGNLENMIPHATEWAMTLLYRIFNHEPSYQLLLKKLHLIKPQIFKQLLEKMALCPEPQHSKIIEILKVIK